MGANCCHSGIIQDKNYTVDLQWVHLDAVSSTNAYLSERVTGNPFGQEIALVADYQSHGKGQGEHTWVSEPGRNLLMSFLLYPAFLSASRQFSLSVITSLAIADLLKEESLQPVIKWPNDMLVRTGKIAGILIENGILGGTLSHSVIGIGLNVNQAKFPVFPVKATSLALETARLFETEELATRLAGLLMDRYEGLKAGRDEAFRQEYLERLHNLNIPAEYQSEGQVFTGVIRGISEFGELLVESEGTVKSYGMHAISLIQSPR